MSSDALVMISDGNFPSLAPTTCGNALENATANLFANMEHQSTFQALIQDLEETLTTYSRNELMENTNNIENYGYNQCNTQQMEYPNSNPFYYENKQQNKRIQKMTNSNNLTVQSELVNLNLCQGAKKRKSHRAVFSPTQLRELEEAFSKTHFVSKLVRRELSTKLNLTETQIKTWFQNKRMKEKKISKSCTNFSANLSLRSTDSCSSGYSMSPSPPQATGFPLNEHQNLQDNNGKYFLHPNYVYQQCKIDLSLYPQNQSNANQYPSETKPFSSWQMPVNGVFQYNGIPYLQQLWNSQFYNNFQYPVPHVIKTEPVEDSPHTDTELQCLNNLSYEHNQTINPYMQNNFWQPENYSVRSTSLESNMPPPFN